MEQLNGQQKVAGTIAPKISSQHRRPASIVQRQVQEVEPTRYERFLRERMIAKGIITPSEIVSRYEGTALEEEQRKLWVAEYKRKLIATGYLIPGDA